MIPWEIIVFGYVLPAIICLALTQATVRHWKADLKTRVGFAVLSLIPGLNLAILFCMTIISLFDSYDSL